MSSIQRLEKHLKNLAGGVSAMSISQSSISQSWSGCPSSGTAQSLSAFASLEKKMAKCNQPSQGTSTQTSSDCSGATTSTANSSGQQASSSEGEHGLDNVDREIERATKEMIKEKTKSFESLLKFITVLCVKCSPLLLYLKLKYATCCQSRLEIANMLCGYNYLGMEVQKLDCYDEHALYVLAAMYSYYNNLPKPSPTSLPPPPTEALTNYVFEVLQKTHYYENIKEQIAVIDQTAATGLNTINTIKSMLNSAAVSIIPRRYNISAIKGVLTGVQLYNDIKTILASTPVFAKMDLIEKGTPPENLTGGARKKHLKKPRKK